MSARERDLHRKMVAETNEEISREKSGRERMFELASLNPGVVFFGGGCGMFITPENEIEESNGVTKVHLSKSERVSGGMVKSESYHLRVYEGMSLVVDEYKKGFGEYEGMKEMFLDHVPDVDSRNEVSISVAYSGSFDQVIEEHNLTEG